MTRAGKGQGNHIGQELAWVDTGSKLYEISQIESRLHLVTQREKKNAVVIKSQISKFLKHFAKRCLVPQA